MKKCIACEGTGKSSRGTSCLPCAGTGEAGAKNRIDRAILEESLAQVGRHEPPKKRKIVQVLIYED